MLLNNYTLVTVQNLGGARNLSPLPSCLYTLTRFINAQRDHNVTAHPANQRRGGRGSADWVRDGQSCGLVSALLKDSRCGSRCARSSSTVSNLLHSSLGQSVFSNMVAVISHNRLSCVVFILFKMCWGQLCGGEGGSSQSYDLIRYERMCAYVDFINCL